MQNSYYWSDDWNEAFYIELAKAGFISTTHDEKEILLLLPELQYDYALLDFQDLHISHKVQKLLKNNDYELCINNRFAEVIERFSQQHKYNWLKGKYAQLLKNLHLNYHPKNNFKVISVELLCKESGELIAGEVGYIIGKTYTSLSGFSSKNKIHTNCGTLQLVLLAKYLEENNLEFWNFGHPHMTYKQKLGCKIYTRHDFLTRWNLATQVPISTEFI
ncbi:MAG: Leu/Phe-tRNA-protein transferase [Sulfurimonas sp.]|jgi:Leu/Phe-tRNA-protein transferase|uniref:hypothetical protein n=1 Tax=Sulfurimonas sp. TaxID=2022749 RepID=UPI0039E6672F